MTDPRRTAVVVSGARTPIGRFLGGLAPLKAPELGGKPARRSTPIAWGGQQGQQLMQSRPHLLQVASARRRTRAGWQMLSQEASDERAVEVRRRQPLSCHPVTEVGEAAQIGRKGPICIASRPQPLDIRGDEFVQRTACKPVTTRKMRQASIGGHGELLW